MGFKLVYITTNIGGIGGVSRILSVKLNYFIEKFCYEVYVLNSNYNDEKLFYHFNKKITFYHFNKKSQFLKDFFEYKNWVIQHLEAISPNCLVICDNGFKASLFSSFLKTKIPIVYERHGSRTIKGETLLDNLKLKLSNLIIDFNKNKYKAFIVLNKYAIQHWKSKNIYIIPNPFWVDMLPTSSTLENKIAIAVGRYSVEKQYDILLKIWKYIIEVNPDWSLKIYGSGNPPGTLINLVEKMDLSSNIEFCNPVMDISQIYSNASMLINTSSSEEFGLAIMEAMAFGLPTIAFKNTLGPKSLIEHEKSGFLIEKGDVKAYQEKVKMLINDFKMRKAFGNHARCKLDDYELDKVMATWHNLFQSFL